MTTGEFKVLECDEDNLISEIYKIEPKEILLTQSLKEKFENIIDKLDVNISTISKVNDAEKFLKDYFNIVSLDSYGIFGK
ncbi:hypothetical protein, partial [Streptobacillus notomytis]|uniref:hypothetical protein n=1 Tax=Streptobacillus notomytis TaxID=1712031 RepID=UPI001FD45480